MSSRPDKPAFDRPQLAIVAADAVLDDLRAATGESLRLIHLDRWIVANSALTEAALGGGASAESLDILNTTVLGLILTPSIGPEKAAIARRLAEAMCIPVHAEGSTSAPGPAIVAWIIEQMAGHLRSAQLFATRERDASARIRRDFAELERDFTEVEDFLYALGAPRFALALDVPPGGGELRIGSRPEGSAEGLRRKSPNESEIEQVLPVPSRALSAIDLHVTALSKGEGWIELELVDSGGTALARVERRPWSTCRLGVNRFAFATGVRGPEKEALLRIRTSVHPGAHLGLATGPATSVGRFAPTIDGRRTGDQVLAMKLWRGLPGISLPPLATAQAKPGQHFVLRPADLAEPRTLSGRSGAASLGKLADELAILIHPSVEGPTLALVPEVEVEHLVSVAASVHVLHPSSPTLGFAIAVLPAGEAERLPEPASALGDWLFLPAKGWGEAHFHLAQPFTGKVDLVLAVAALAPAERRDRGAFRSFRLRFADQADG